MTAIEDVDPRVTDMPTERLGTFADGVLAIVITLLVLELHVPSPDDSTGLAELLLEDWRQFGGYLISFVFVGGLWIASASVDSFIRRADPVLYRIHLLALFFVSFMPFTTSLMTTHLGSDGERLAVSIYGANLLIASITMNAFMKHAAHLAKSRGAIDDGAALERVEKQRRLTVVVLGIAAVLAVAVPRAAVAAYLIASLLFLVAPLIQARHRRRLEQR